MPKRLRSYVPALNFGAKVFPEDMAMLAGAPVVGDVFYVDANNGNDTDNGGDRWNDAYKTFSAAEDAVATNNYDMIVVAPGGTSGTADSATITFDKNHVTVVGGAAPVSLSSRSRITWGTDAVDPCITISGVGNRFVNLQMATFQASNDVLVSLTGDRNYFANVHFAGIGHATAGDDATARCLSLSGAEENNFDFCTFGLDTVMRSTTNATVEFASGSDRNIFSDSRFIMAADNVGPNHVLLTGAAAITRWLQFDNCLWYSFWTNDADKVTHVIDAAAQTTTGHILMTGRQLMVGFDDWEAVASGNVYFEPYTATLASIGIGVNPTV